MLLVNLRNIRHKYYSSLDINHITSDLGEPILAHTPCLDLTRIEKAEFFVEMELDKLFPKLIACDDKQVNIYLVEVRNGFFFFKSKENMQ